jgi:hypothetical protein
MVASAILTKSILSTEGQAAKEQIRKLGQITTVNTANKYLFMANLAFSIATAKGIMRVVENRSNVSMGFTSFIGFKPSRIRDFGVESKTILTSFL